MANFIYYNELNNIQLLKVSLLKEVKYLAFKDYFRFNKDKTTFIFVGGKG